MYRIRTGEFAGKTVEQAILENAPAMYMRGHWAAGQLEAKPNLRPLVEEFQHLESLLDRARVKERCAKSGCHRRASRMSTEWSLVGRLMCRFWCDHHEPQEDPEDFDIVPISLDSMSTVAEEADRKILSEEVLRAYGLKPGTRITEKFAHDFFASLTKISGQKSKT